MLYFVVENAGNIVPFNYSNTFLIISPALFLAVPFLLRAGAWQSSISKPL